MGKKRRTRKRRRTKSRKKAELNLMLESIDTVVRSTVSDDEDRHVAHTTSYALTTPKISVLQNVFNASNSSQNYQCTPVNKSKVFNRQKNLESFNCTNLNNLFIKDSPVPAENDLMKLNNSIVCKDIKLSGSFSSPNLLEHLKTTPLEMRKSFSIFPQSNSLFLVGQEVNNLSFVNNLNESFKNLSNMNSSKNNCETSKFCHRDDLNLTEKNVDDKIIFKTPYKAASEALKTPKLSSTDAKLTKVLNHINNQVQFDVPTLKSDFKPPNKSTPIINFASKLNNLNSLMNNDIKMPKCNEQKARLHELSKSILQQQSIVKSKNLSPKKMYSTTRLDDDSSLEGVLVQSNKAVPEVIGSPSKYRSLERSDKLLSLSNSGGIFRKFRRIHFRFPVKWISQLIQICLRFGATLKEGFKALNRSDEDDDESGISQHCECKAKMDSVVIEIEESKNNVCAVRTELVNIQKLHESEKNCQCECKVEAITVELKTTQSEFLAWKIESEEKYSFLLADHKELSDKHAALQKDVDDIRELLKTLSFKTSVMAGPPLPPPPPPPMFLPLITVTPAIDNSKNKNTEKKKVETFRQALDFEEMLRVKLRPTDKNHLGGGWEANNRSEGNVLLKKEKSLVRNNSQPIVTEDMLKQIKLRPIGRRPQNPSSFCASPVHRVAASPHSEIQTRIIFNADTSGRRVKRLQRSSRRDYSHNRERERSTTGQEN